MTSSETREMEKARWDLKRGRTTAAFKSLGISDDTKERLNRLVIVVAEMAANNFRKRGGGLPS